MENLFKQNLSSSQTKAQDCLRANIDFCKKLIRDLENTFNVVVRERRYSETEYEITVYPPGQVDRYGWGFTFLASNSGVYFSDGRGSWLESFGTIFGLKMRQHTPYEERKMEVERIRKAAKKIGVEVIHSPDTACGDHFGVKTTLSPDDKHLNKKIKAIIGTMMLQKVTTRL